MLLPGDGRMMACVMSMGNWLTLDTMSTSFCTLHVYHSAFLIRVLPSGNQ